MKTGYPNISFADANRLDLVDYLSRLGFDPQRVSRQNYWYYSPFHRERTPSFKVDRRINCWYDFSVGRGGRLVDFGMDYHGCSAGRFLQKLASFSGARHKVLYPSATAKKEEGKIIIRRTGPIITPVLLHYLEKRRISLPIAQKFCREISFENQGKIYCAIGFSNDAGGYELRNEYFKGCSSPKSISTIGNRTKILAVFEGFFDFLSYLSVRPFKGLPGQDFLILNSLSFFEKAKPLMMQQDLVQLFLDRDASGRQCTQKALALGSHFRDESGLYRTHKDFNDWIMHIGQSPRAVMAKEIPGSKDLHPSAGNVER